jgi:hypothetical protein
MPEFKIKDILPNPYRRMDHYPIRRDKVEALKESLSKTGFWDNVVGRSKNGKVEIAYGHHRWVALQEFYGANHRVNLIIKNLSDEIMLQMMARENMEEWGTSAIVEIETVQAVVEAYATGAIELEKPNKLAREYEVRFAPSFISDTLGTSRAYPYSALTIAKFLGWTMPNGNPQDKVRIAIVALQYIEEGLLEKKDFVGLNTSQCDAVIREARRVRTYRENIAKAHEKRAKEAEAEAQEFERKQAQAKSSQEAHGAKIAKFRAEERRKHAELEAHEEHQKARKAAIAVARTVGSNLKTGGYGVRDARELAEKVERIERTAPPPRIEKYLRDTLSAIERILQPRTDKQAERLEEILKWKDDLDEITLEDAARTLEQLAERATEYASRFSTINNKAKMIK